MPKFKSPQSVWDSFRYKVMVLGTSSQLITSDLLLAHVCSKHPPQLSQ